MSFKFATFAVGATAVAATVAYFITVPPVQSHAIRSISERGGEGFGADARETAYPYGPETYQYPTPAFIAPDMRFVSRPVVKKFYVYRRNPCKARKQITWHGLPLNR